MFNEKGELVMLDFQFLSEGDPMWDLGVAILLNTNFINDKEAIHQLLSIYYETTKETLVKMNYPRSFGTLEGFTER